MSIEIYMVSRIDNSKSYVGMTSRKAYGNGNLITLAKAKYGKSAFVHMILAKTEDREEACLLEKFYISFFQTLQPNGYNIALGGYGGDCHTDETKKKMSTSLLRYYRANPNAVIEMSENSKGRPSHKKGVKVSDEVRLRMIIARNKNLYKHTDVYKNKMREIFTGRVMSDETKLKMSIAAKARANTPEGLERLKSASMKALEKRT